MKTPIVSFVVPIYGVAKYLPACLESLRAQTMPDFCAILVDDGSTDGCAQICDDFAAKDERFQVIHQKNGGRSRARNAGLEACKTEWIWFVDGDDQIEPDALEKLMGCMQQDFDLILTSPRGSIPENSYRELTELERRQLFLLAIDDTQRNVPMEAKWLFDFLFAPVVFKLFRRSFVEEQGLRFDKTLTVGEDRVFFIRAARNSRHVAAIKGLFYRYIQHEGSVSYKYTDQIMTWNEKLFRALRPLVEEDPEALKRYDCYVVDGIKLSLRLYFMHPMNDMPMRTRRRELRALTRQNYIKEAMAECDWKLAGFKLWLFALLCKTGSLHLIYHLYANLFHINVQQD